MPLLFASFRRPCAVRQCLLICEVVTDLGNSSSAGTAKYSWSCWKKKCEKHYSSDEFLFEVADFEIRATGQLNNDCYFSVWILIGKSLYWSIYNFKGKEYMLLCLFWQPWLLTQCLIYCGNTGMLPTLRLLNRPQEYWKGFVFQTKTEQNTKPTTLEGEQTEQQRKVI